MIDYKILKIILAKRVNFIYTTNSVYIIENAVIDILLGCIVFKQIQINLNLFLTPSLLYVRDEISINKNISNIKIID